jgi:thermolysin
MKGNYDRLENIVNGIVAPATGDLASDSDNDWADGATVDAHAYIGLTYDYFYERFKRRGLDDNNRPMRGYVHPIPRDQWESLYSKWNALFTNAFYAGDGVMVFGEGLPGNVRAGGKAWNYVAGALDVVAHELTHGVTDYSSNLIYRDESGALNEAFSDVMAVGAEFLKQPAKSDYLLGEDVVTPGGLRSIQDPMSYGNPDHYSVRYIGTDDNGGVHKNSTIASHAFYLAIEGGTNRTSGLSVEGVGAARRDQMEKVFYRAFVYLLGSNANFATARGATIQAARDLYGAGSAVERAITQAWTAVGVM